MTAPADVELMRRAARAAGYRLECWETARDAFKVMDESVKAIGSTRWNPLANDGQALRLAMHTNLSIERGQVRTPGDKAFTLQTGVMRSTRRAIVAAAADQDPISTNAPNGQKARA